MVKKQCCLMNKKANFRGTHFKSRNKQLAFSRPNYTNLIEENK